MREIEQLLRRRGIIIRNQESVCNMMKATIDVFLGTRIFIVREID